LQSPFILALDIGTSSVRAALYDVAGNVLPATMVKNERQLKITEDGGAEIDALEAFRQVEKAIDDVLKKAKNLTGEIEYVAASAFWHSLVGVDKKGEPTTKVFGWADTRSKKQVAILRDSLDENKTHNRTGARFHSSYWTAKLLWLRQEQPKVFRQTARWLSFSDFISLKLFGETATSVSMASGTGIFDIRKCIWDEEILNFLKIEKENLPEIVYEDTQTFQLNETYAKRWAKLKNSQWFQAIGDGAANNIGANCLTENKAALMIGTSGAMRVAFAGKPPRKIPNGLWCYRIDRKRILIGGALSDGGGLYRWLKETHKINDIDDIVEAEIKRREADSHGLTFLPFLAGERGTGYHETAKGAILGLHSSTTAVEIVQAALESVAYRFAEIFDQLKDVAEIKEIIASGGALRESPVWTQIICDVLNQKMILPETREASSTGAVLLALEAIGKIKNIENLKTPKGLIFKPNSAKHKIYKKARERHEKFYKLLID
jgi:gluconokinase